MFSLLSHSPRIGVFGAALALATTGMMAPSIADARAPAAPYYTAELAAPASEATVIAGGLAWNCAGTQCVATKGTSRPIRICNQLKRDVGTIVSFTANGEALDADKLAQCNG